MKINKLFVSNYKNLLDCDVRPDGLHAITGCNGSGKSNLLEIPQFLASFLSGSDQSRKSLLETGWSPVTGRWFPILDDAANVAPLCIELDCNIVDQNKEWNVNYRLEFTKLKYISKYKFEEGVKVAKEQIRLKEIGKSGPSKLILNRNVEGVTTVSYEISTRKKFDFKSKLDMSSIQTLEVRMAEDFTESFPVLSKFYNGIISIDILKLNPSKLNDLCRNPDKFNRMPGSILDAYPLFAQIQQIKENETDWNQYLYWTKKLCDIDNIETDIETSDVSSEGSKTVESYYIFIFRQNQILLPHELSTGCAMLLALVTALFSFLKTSGAIFIEEPESYLHPKALIDLLILLRDISDEITVVFTTHSPVSLNSMKASEVTLMKQKENGFVSSANVSEIKEAVATLNRGHLSFGDLLQSNFTTEE